MGDLIRVEWDVVSTSKARMLVADPDTARPATIDDLKRACEAVGLHVATQEENTERAAQARQMASALAEVRSQLEQAEADTGIGLRALVATYIAACKDLGVNLGNLGLGVDRALGAAASDYAAGYAAAVADIRRWLVLEVKAARGERRRARCNEYSCLIGILDIGAHVGAAKRGEK